jgi:hypothetical protein
MEGTGNASYSSGISFSGLLTIVFIALKLTHYIDWPWWWVLSPLWISLAICLVILAIIFFVVFLVD